MSISQTQLFPDFWMLALLQEEIEIFFDNKLKLFLPIFTWYALNASELSLFSFPDFWAPERAEKP